MDETKMKPSTVKLTLDDMRRMIQADCIEGTGQDLPYRSIFDMEEAEALAEAEYLMKLEKIRELQPA
jgi:hypothetical protein